MAIDSGVRLPKDSIASITTAGLLGDAYVSLSPGGADQDLADGDRITHTEPALNVSDLLGRYAFGGAKGPESSGDAARVPPPAPERPAGVERAPAPSVPSAAPAMESPP